MAKLRQVRLGLVLSGLLATATAGCASGVSNSSQQQDLVDRSTLTLQEMMNSSSSHDAISALRGARAVMICPQVFKAGFILGGSGGSCVLAARAAAGSWSDPAFYTIGSGSIGAQAGIQDAGIMIMIMNDRALRAVMNNQFKIGGDASLAVATVGAGVGGATTTAMRADILTFAQTRGLFAGVSIEGSVLSASVGANQSYYGQPYSAPQIVVQMQANNPGADPLRRTLSNFGG